MNLFLAICWSFMFIWSLAGMFAGFDPNWITCLVPTFCLAFINWIDYAKEKI